MIGWIFTSILLSLTGVLIYRFAIPLIPGPRERKLMLYTVLGLSLILPFFIHSHTHVSKFQDNPFYSTASSGNIVSPQTVEEYCHCSEPAKGELMMFEASKLYDFLLDNSGRLMILPALVALILLVRLFLQVVRLRMLAARSKSEMITVGNRQVMQLTEVQDIPAASFRFFRSYLIWHPSLDLLAPKERNAVLQHEASHLQQLNTWEELFMQVLQTMWFFNPAFYFLQNELRKLSEFIADDEALNTGINSREYALLLLKLKSQPLPLGSQGFSGSLLKQRIERIATPTTPRKNGVLPLIVITFFALNGVNIFSENVIRHQIEELEVYEYLSETYQETGKTAYCKSCTYENVFGTESN